MSDHDDLLAEADATRALFEDVMGPSDATELLGRLAAALRAVTAERDALRQIVRTLDALVPKVTRPDIWPAEQADVIRRALEQETPDGE